MQAAMWMTRCVAHFWVSLVKQDLAAGSVIFGYCWNWWSSKDPSQQDGVLCSCFTLNNFISPSTVLQKLTYVELKERSKGGEV